MNTGKPTEKAPVKRICLFADGIVGSSILATVIADAPDSLIALVVNCDSILDGLKLPPACEVKHWNHEDEAATVEWLRSKGLDIIFLAWWPYLLRGDILDAAPMILNTHPSLLPHCRGKDPNFWAIVEREPYGVSIHHVNSAIDAGDIAFQREIPITWLDTGATLSLKGMNTMVELFDEALPSIVGGEVPRIPQGEGGRLHYRKQLAGALAIDLDAPTTARELLNRLRAGTFAPWPACRFEDDGKSYEVRVDISALNHDD